MKNPMISLIVPAWNAEKFFVRCFDSIKNQSYTNFEVLIINPSSSDNTAKIAEKYCATDNRFKHIPSERLTSGQARNRGIDMAKGEFLAFSDADDIMEPDMLFTLCNAAVSENADITVCDYNIVYPDRTEERVSKLIDLSVNLNDNTICEYYYRYCAAPKPNNYCWSRLYRKEFVGNIRQKELTMGEDHLFNLTLLLNSPNISHVGKALYNYMQHDESIVRTEVKRGTHGNIYLLLFEQVRNLLENNNRAYSEPIISIYAYTRIKSILFYAWLAKLDENGIKKACEDFLQGDKTAYYLGRCIEGNYIKQYCDMHGFSPQWKKAVHEMIYACLNKTKLPDMREIFK